ncbi:GNAT family N-acetyltransferase [Methylobacterium currus]|uniref:GNAT family N-acetyltransferase n=1 Tax=Methylobacterium currus TaxID=2051553 RepID=UPI001E6526CD|nr:GNAT family N-acetyltransferase [Methylobacterium currus]UHC15074.1 GNAT family N-acetyltransferase [Methylobacterium currus]
MAAPSGSLPLFGGLGLRPPRPSDQAFLLQLFVESRPWLSLAGDDRDMLQALYEQQYAALRAGLETAYPEHLDFILERTGQAVGRVLIDLGRADWRLSELQVAAAARGKGIGTDLVRSLQAAAERVRLPITLSTPMVGATDGRALYERLGFRVTAVRPPHYAMAWSPPGVPLPPAAGAGLVAG